MNKKHFSALSILKKASLYFSPPLLIIGFILSGYYYLGLRETESVLETDERLNVDILNKEISMKIQNIADDLIVLTAHFELEVLLESDEHLGQLSALTKEFVTFSRLKKIYNRVDLLDRFGMEIIRVRFMDGSAKSLPLESLRNLSGQSDINKIRQLKRGEIYISSPKLNHHRHEAGEPDNPVIRFGTALFNKQGKRKGSLVIDYDMGNLLKELEEHPSRGRNQYLFVDQNHGRNQIVLNRQPGEETWRLRPEAEKYPALLGELSGKASGQFISEKGLVTFCTIFPEIVSMDGMTTPEESSHAWKLISIVPANLLYAEPTKSLNRLLLVFTLFSIVLGLSSFSLAQTKLRREFSERELEKSRERYRQLVEGALYGIVETDTTGLITYANDAYHRMLGYASGELIGSSSMNLISEKKRQQMAFDIAARISDHPEPELYEGQLIKKDGSIIDVEIAWNYQYNDQSVNIGFISLVTDISARKQVETALQASEERFREIAETIEGVFRVISPDYRQVYYVSRAFESVWMRSRESLYAHPEIWFDAVDPRDQAGVQSAIQENILKKSSPIKSQDHFNEEYRIVRPEGTVRWIHDLTFPVRDRDGVVIRHVGIATDITVRKETEKRIKKALSEKEVLLQEIQHRVKNNLQVIGSLLYLQAKSVKDKKEREKFKETQERVQSMALVHEQLYRSENIARINFGKYIMNLAKILINSYNIEQRPVTVSIDVEDLTVGVDLAIPCGLILNELITNAFKHAFPENQKGKISIGLHAKEGEGFEITVSDDGIGVPESLDLKKSGTLGLRLVTLLLEQLEGSITLRKTRGTSFKIFIEELK